MKSNFEEAVERAFLLGFSISLKKLEASYDQAEILVRHEDGREFGQFVKRDYHLSNIPAMIDFCVDHALDLPVPIKPDVIEAPIKKSMILEGNFLNRHTNPLPKHKCHIIIIHRQGKPNEENTSLCQWVPKDDNDRRYAEGYLGCAKAIDGIAVIGYNVWQQNNQEFIYYKVVADHIAELLAGPKRTPCQYCGKEHYEYACNEQIEHLKTLK